MKAIQTKNLFAPLHKQLLELLHGLQPLDWQRPTVAGTWTVKQLVAHLLDTMLRRVSSLDTQFQFSSPATPITDYPSLVLHVNTFNATWITATERLSPTVLIGLLEWVEPRFLSWLDAQDMNAVSNTGVGWAGETISRVWFDIAREFTEQWHHQQQIRDAVQQPILTAYLHPVLETFLQGLPHRYLLLDAPSGTGVNLQITGSEGGHWNLRFSNTGWVLRRGNADNAVARIECNQDTAWRLFTKGISSVVAREKIRFESDERFLLPFLNLIAVIA